MADIKRFFDDYLNIGKMLEEKREYREMMARVKALPEDYRFVFEKMQKYMWGFATGSGYDMMALQEGLVELFEEGAAQGRPVLDVTGTDVAAFADELIKGARTYTGDQSEKLNAAVAKKLT